MGKQRLAGYEILEHTADLGIRSWGASLEEAFEQAAWGLIDVVGVRAEGPGQIRRLQASTADEAALLVDFLNELLFLIDSEDVGVVRIDVRAGGTELEAGVEVVSIPGQPEGVTVKAATYHQLEVRHASDGGVEARVYLDV